MSQHEHDDKTTPAEKCETADSMLKRITQQINEFDVKKLGELKKELETFTKAQDDLVKDYEKQYPTLRSKWCDQQARIQTLYAQIKCAFPGQDWKKIVEECICPPRHDLICLEKKIARRKKCCYGKLQKELDAATTHFTETKARLDTLKANAAEIDKKLKADETLYGEIQTLLGQPDKAVALYKFWFVLLPAHRSLIPGDVAEDCKTFGDAEDPDTLCKNGPCPPDDGPCVPREGETEGEPASHPRRRAVPWLIAPKKYRDELDCAWKDYLDAKDELGKADSAFKNAPDDIPSLVAKLDADKKSLEETIRKCLETKKPDDTCCKPPADPKCED